jgi:thiazolinyl reductase component of yersiniabactin synthetase
MQVLLCGTNYGAQYVQALWNCAGGMRLAGILSRGSERSRALARQLGTSHFTALVDVVAGSIDAAIVAVPGEDGVKLVMALLERGVHVMAEHPWEPEALDKAIAAAQTKKLAFNVNSHFGDLECVDLFLRHADRGAQAPPIFLNLAVNTRTLYSAIDIVGRLLFLNAPRPFQFTPASPSAADPSSPAFFATVHGLIGDVPIAIHCQRYSSAVDDGLATFVNHRVVLGFMDGNLMLGDTFGPLVWMPRILPQTQWAHTAWTLLSPAPNESAGAYSAAVRDRANRAACERFAAQIATGGVAAMQRPEYLSQVSRTWRSALDSLWRPAKMA